MPQADAVSERAPSRDSGQPSPRAAARRRARWVAAGFLLAFALTVATVILTGLLVRGSRGSEADAPALWPPSAGHAPQERPRDPAGG